MMRTQGNVNNSNFYCSEIRKNSQKVLEKTVKNDICLRNGTKVWWHTPDRKEKVVNPEGPKGKPTWHNALLGSRNQTGKYLTTKPAGCFIILLVARIKDKLFIQLCELTHQSSNCLKTKMRAALGMDYTGWSFIEPVLLLEQEKLPTATELIAMWHFEAGPPEISWVTKPDQPMCPSMMQLQLSQLPRWQQTAPAEVFK